MRSFEPRLWNLLPTTALLAAACGPPGIPVDESFGDGLEVDDEAESPDSASEGQPECTVDTDCSPGYYCANEVCQPSTYTDYSDYSDYADNYTDYSDYSDWNDNYTDYSDYSDYGETDTPWYDCYSDYDCQPGYICLYNTCSPKPPDYSLTPAECDGPAVVEIPIPDLGVVLDLQMADVDGDADDELVALVADGVVVIQDDDSVVLTPWLMPPPVPLRQLALLELDGDGAIDLVAFPDVLGPAIVALGDGTGNFAALGEMANAPLVDRPLGFDGELDGIDRLLALRPDVDRITQFSDPTQLSGNNTLVGPTGASDLDLLDVDPILAPDVLIGVACAASVRTGPALSAVTFLMDPGLGVGICDWHAAAFIDGTPDQPLLVFSQGDLALMRRYDVANGTFFQIQVPLGPTSSAVANLDGSGDFLLLTDPNSGRLVWGWTDEDPGCMALLPFSGTLDFAVGDRTGDGSQDVATLDNMGVVRLWSVP